MTQKKNATNVKNADVKNQSVKKIVNLNLTKFADVLKNVDVKEKKDKDTIYLYPETFSKSDINSEKGKKFRNSLRTKIQKFENNIFVFAKQNNSEKLTETIAEFDVFYKTNYKVNDYTVKSVSSSSNEIKEQSFTTMFEIIKHVKASQQK